MILEDPGQDYLLRWHIWATAWRDDETNHIRRSIKPIEKLAYPPINRYRFRLCLEEMVAELRPKVPALNLRGGRADYILITPLA